MGTARRRAAPRVVNHVNRNLEGLTVRLVVKTVYQLPPPWRRSRRGRPPHDPRVVAVCCILMAMFGKTYDGIEAYVKECTLLHRLLRAERMPGHSVIYRGMGRLPLPYVRRVMAGLVVKYRRYGLTVAVDSTGFRLSTSSTWFDIRIRRVGSRKEYLKLHVAMDVATGLVLAFVITDWRGSDGKQLKRLLRSLPRIARALGDGAYSSRYNCEVVVEKGGKPFFKFKANATGRARGSVAWKASYRDFQGDPEGWMKVYHLRSLVESLFGSMKRRFGSGLRSRRGWRRRKELALKVLCYDMKQVLYLERAAEVGTDLWVEA